MRFAFAGVQFLLSACVSDDRTTNITQGADNTLIVPINNICAAAGAQPEFGGGHVKEVFRLTKTYDIDRGVIEKALLRFFINSAIGDDGETENVVQLIMEMYDNRIADPLMAAVLFKHETGQQGIKRDPNWQGIKKNPFNIMEGAYCTNETTTPPN